jgi:hypothetical protein
VRLLQAEHEEDPGLCSQPTGSTGWAVLLGIGEGKGYVVDYDERNGALEYAIDGCGSALKWLEIDYDPGEDLVLLWLRGHVYGDGNLEFSVVGEPEVLEAEAGKGLEEEEAEEIDLIDFTGLGRVHLGLSHENCSHAIKEPTYKIRVLGLHSGDVEGWRCYLCGLHARRTEVLSWLQNLILQRAA